MLQVSLSRKSMTWLVHASNIESSCWYRSMGDTRVTVAKLSYMSSFQCCSIFLIAFFQGLAVCILIVDISLFWSFEGSLVASAVCLPFPVNFFRKPITDEFFFPSPRVCSASSNWLGTASAISGCDILPAAEDLLSIGNLLQIHCYLFQIGEARFWTKIGMDQCRLV